MGDGNVPWSFSHQRYSFARRKYGITLPCCIQSCLRKAFSNEAVWFHSQDLERAARRLRQAGWSRVEAQDFHLTLGPRAELRVKPEITSDMVLCLWDVTWGVLSVETEPGSGRFRPDWGSARPALLSEAC